MGCYHWRVPTAKMGHLVLSVPELLEATVCDRDGQVTESRCAEGRLVFSLFPPPPHSLAVFLVVLRVQCEHPGVWIWAECVLSTLC